MQDQSDAMWTNGSYEETAPVYYPMAGQLVDRTGVAADDEVLDVGCGTGSVAITAARRGAGVTGVDVTPEMLDLARENAETAGTTDVDWRDGDACDLPVADDAVDVALSSLGHMYGDPPGETTRELLRVTRAGGRLGFTSWTPTSAYPFMASVLTTYLPADELPDFTEPPFAWGDSGVVRDRLERQVEELSFETGTVLFPALSPAHFWEKVAATSGPFIEFLDEVPEKERAELREELIDTVRPYFDDRHNGVELEYLLTTARL